MDAWKSIAYDAVVIGSGPGGASVAAELSRQGRKVLILEWGSAAAIKGSFLQTCGMALIPGRSLFITPDMLGLMRGITLGGSSVMAYASAFEPPYEIFEMHGIDLKPDVEQAMLELPIAPLKEELLGQTALHIKAAARDLGYPWENLPKIVHQDNCRLNCDKCTYGCPYGAKWSAREFIDQACSTGSILLTGARVTGLESDQHQVTGVQFSMAGTRHRVSAPLVVLSAGGLGTPPILHSVGIMQAGRDFFVDPLIVVVGLLNDLDDGNEFPMAAGYDNEDGGYLITDCVLPSKVRTIFTLPVFRLDRLGGHKKSLQIMVKIKDNLAGTLNRGVWVNKRLTDSDRKKIKRGVEQSRQILKHAGAYNIYSTMILAAHPGGTAKIGDVVDSNLKTRYDNLFVCDASVIPASWGKPPILTLIALGKRLASHLANM